MILDRLASIFTAVVMFISGGFSGVGDESYTPVYSGDGASEQSFYGEDDKFFDLVTTFSGDPHTSRAFAWEAQPGYENMVIQYGVGYSEYMYQLKAQYERFPVSFANNDIPEVADAVYDAEYVPAMGDMLFYRVSIKDLQPGTTYTYRIGDTEKDEWSDFYEFKTEPENNDKFSVIAVTDPQGRTAEEYEYYKMTLNAAKKDCPGAAFVINMGDFTDNGNYDDWWKYFFDASVGTKESLPLMTAIGNHENRGAAAKYYNLHFFNPTNAAGLARWYHTNGNDQKALPIIKNLDNTVYSFDYGNAHFAVLNSGTDWEPNQMRTLLQLQKYWLEGDLAATDKQWKVLMIHIGIYVQKPRENLCREIFGELVDKYGVDLVLEGHDHTYMRTYQMYNGAAVSEELENYKKGDGALYSIIGSAALKRYESDDEHPWTAVLRSIPEKTPSYTIIDFNDKRISFTEKLTDGTVIDSFNITQREEAK